MSFRVKTRENFYYYFTGCKIQIAILYFKFQSITLLVAKKSIEWLTLGKTFKFYNKHFGKNLQTNLEFNLTTFGKF